jgi:hypothetical protein
LKDHATQEDCYLAINMLRLLLVYLTPETMVGQVDESSNYATANNIVLKDIREIVKSVS